MDSKQAPPPPYADAPGSQNVGYSQGPGDQGGLQAPPQAGYPQGYGAPQQPGTGYGAPPPAGYYQPPQGGYPPAQAGGYTYSQAVVVNQPTRPGMVVNTVPDHMGLAIFTTLCCCWPLGLVAIMRASESRRALERGDFQAASTYSQEARRYSMWAIAGGCVSIVVAIIIIVVYVTTASSYYYTG